MVPGAAAPADETPLSAVTPQVIDTASAEDIDRRQDAKIARGLGSNPAGGILVADTPPGSPAAELRLQAGDVITSVNGEGVTTPEDFVRIYRAQGLPTQLTVQRGDRELHLH